MNSARFVDTEEAAPSSTARGRIISETPRLLNAEATRKIIYVERSPVPGRNEEIGIGIERGFNPRRGMNYVKTPRHVQGKGNSLPFGLRDQSESPRRNMLLKESSSGKRYWDSETYFDDSVNYKFDGYKYQRQIEGNEHERYLVKDKVPDSYYFPEDKARGRVLVNPIDLENYHGRYPYEEPIEPYYREAKETDEYYSSDAKKYYHFDANEGYVQERRNQRYPFKDHTERESYRASYEDRFAPNRDGYLRNYLVQPESPMHQNHFRSRKLQYQEPIISRFSPDDNPRLSSDDYPPLFPASHDMRSVKGKFFPSQYEEPEDPIFLGKREILYTAYEPQKRIRKDGLYPPNSEEVDGFGGFDFEDHSYPHYETHDSNRVRFNQKWVTRTGQTAVESSELNESSEEFKQKVDKAFLIYSKNINISKSVRNKYLNQKGGSLFCVVCRKERLKFPDTETLAKHALTSRQPEHRAEHVALHKAICVVMGWDTCRPSRASEWEPIPLPMSEAWARREDLILWPPVVIVRNLPFSVTPPEKVTSFLIEKGLVNGKMNVCLGQPADQSVILVKFLGTFTGLDGAERVNRYFCDNFRGRGNYHTRAKGGGSGKSTDDLDVYGYLGTASDLEFLDVLTRKHVVIKSKKSIMDFANEPVKPNDFDKE